LRCRREARIRYLVEPWDVWRPLLDRLSSPDFDAVPESLSATSETAEATTAVVFAARDTRAATFFALATETRFFGFLLAMLSFFLAMLLRIPIARHFIHREAACSTADKVEPLCLPARSSGICMYL